MHAQTYKHTHTHGTNGVHGWYSCNPDQLFWTHHQHFFVKAETKKAKTCPHMSGRSNSFREAMRRSCQASNIASVTILHFWGLILITAGAYVTCYIYSGSCVKQAKLVLAISA